MDGPISTSEMAGLARQAASVPFRNPAVSPPEKVLPVSEGNRSRSSVRDEAGLPGKVDRNPARRDRKAGAGGPAETQAPPDFLELRPGEAEGSGRDRQTGSSEDAPPSPLGSGVDTGREALPLPGNSSTPAPRMFLAEALAAARARWAEVNEEALEASTLPAQPLAEKALDPTAPSGKADPDVDTAGVLQRRLTIRYENLATSLSNPHPTRPVIDLFV